MKENLRISNYITIAILLDILFLPLSIPFIIYISKRHTFQQSLTVVIGNSILLCLIYGLNIATITSIILLLLIPMMAKFHRIVYAIFSSGALSIIVGQVLQLNVAYTLCFMGGILLSTLMMYVYFDKQVARRLDIII